MHHIARDKTSLKSLLIGLVKIKYTLSLKIGIFFYQKPEECENFLFCQKTDKRISPQELEKTNTDEFMGKLNNRFDRTHLTHCDGLVQNVGLLFRPMSF